MGLTSGSWGACILLNNCLERAVEERLLFVTPVRECKLQKLEKKEIQVLPQGKTVPHGSRRAGPAGSALPGIDCGG